MKKFFAFLIIVISFSLRSYCSVDTTSILTISKLHVFLELQRLIPTKHGIANTLVNEDLLFNFMENPAIEVCFLDNNFYIGDIIFTEIKIKNFLNGDEVFNTTCKEFILGIIPGSRITFKLKGFRVNEFEYLINYLKNSSYEYYLNRSKKFAKNYYIEKVDLYCLMSSLKKGFLSKKKKFSCLYYCSY